MLREMTPGGQLANLALKQTASIPASTNEDNKRIFNEEVTPRMPQITGSEEEMNSPSAQRAMKLVGPGIQKTIADQISHFPGLNLLQAPETK